VYRTQDADECALPRDGRHHQGEQQHEIEEGDQAYDA